MLPSMARLTGSYLQRRRGWWFVQVLVPKPLRDRGLVTSRTGKPLQKVERYLNTQDRRVAERKKHAVIADVKAMFDRLLAGLSVTDDDVERVAAAEEWRVYNLLDENHRDYQD